MEKLKTSSLFLCRLCSQAFTLRIKLKRHVERYHQGVTYHLSRNCGENNRKDSDSSEATTNDTRKDQWKENGKVIYDLIGSTTGGSTSGEEPIGCSVLGSALSETAIKHTSKCASTRSPRPFLIPQTVNNPFPRFESLRDQESPHEDTEAPENTRPCPMNSTESYLNFLKSSVSPGHAVECIAHHNQRYKVRKKYLFFGRNLKRGKKLPWRCPYCPIRFFSSFKYYRHIRSHKGERRKNVPSAAQSKKSKVLLGFQSKHDNNGKHLYDAHKLDQLERQKETAHKRCDAEKRSSDSEYNCPACSKSFRQFSRIFFHVQFDHKVSECEALSWLVSFIADDGRSLFKAYTEHESDKGEDLLRCNLCATSNVLWERRLFWTHLTSMHDFSLGAAFHMSGTPKSKPGGIEKPLECSPDVRTVQITNTEGNIGLKNERQKSKREPSGLKKIPEQYPVSSSTSVGAQPSCLPSSHHEDKRTEVVSGDTGENDKEAVEEDGGKEARNSVPRASQQAPFSDLIDNRYHQCVRCLRYFRRASALRYHVWLDHDWEEGVNQSTQGG